MLKWLLLGLFTATAQMLAAQTLSDIKLNALYSGKMDEVLAKVATETKVKFDFDQTKLSQIELTDRPFDEALDHWLSGICKARKLKWYQTKDGVIHILGLYENPEANNLAAKPKGSRGEPSRTNFTLSGIIKDKSSGEALPFVNVHVLGTAIVALSNVDGHFTLLNVPADTCTLEFKYLGYRRARVYLSQHSPVERLPVEMEPETTDLAEITVSADREELLQASGGSTSLLKMSPSKLATLPSLGEHDIFRAFQLMPGISGANEQSAGLYVRGGTPDQVLTLFDGFTVYNVDHMFGFFSAFNSNSIKDVQLFKGVFDAKYGGRLAAVMDITGKDGNDRSFNAGGELSLLSANLWVEQPLSRKLTTIVTFRKSYQGPLYTSLFDAFRKSTGSTQQPDRPGRFTGTSVVSWFYDMNVKTTWKPTAKDVVSFSFYSGKDKLDNSPKIDLPSGFSGRFNFEITDVTDWGNTGGSLKWSRRYNKKLYSNSLISYSTYFSNRDRSNSRTENNPDGTTSTFNRGVKENNRLEDFSAKSDWELKLSDQSVLEFGGALTYNKIKYSFSQNDTTTLLDRNSNGVTASAYVQDKFSFNKGRVKLIPGLRADYFSPTGKPYFEPRLDFQYQMNKRVTLKAAGGHYAQFVKRVVREDVLSGSRDFWVLTDGAKLPVAGSNQFVGGLAYETKDWLFNAEAYYKTLSGISEYSVRYVPSFQSLNYQENFYNGTGRVRGVDLLLQKKYGRYNGWIAYTLGEVRHNFPIYGENDFYASHDVTHEFKFVNLYKWKHWDFSLAFVYASGRPYTAPEGGYQIKLLDGTYQDFLNVSTKNAYRLPAYHHLDLAATYNFRFISSPASLSGSIYNVYNHKNIWYREYEIVDNQLISTDVNYLGMTPNLTFSIKLR
jgi:ferric enterobactin receptor